MLWEEKTWEIVIGGPCVHICWQVGRYNLGRKKCTLMSQQTTIAKNAICAKKFPK